MYLVKLVTPRVQAFISSFRIDYKITLSQNFRPNFQAAQEKYWYFEKVGVKLFLSHTTEQQKA